MQEDRRAFTNDYVKAWAGRRWRNLFLQEGAKDKAALKVAKKALGKDKRPAAQQIAERFLKNDDYLEWQLDMPEAQISKLDNTTLIFCPGLINGLRRRTRLDRLIRVTSTKWGQMKRSDKASSDPTFLIPLIPLIPIF